MYRELAFVTLCMVAARFVRVYEPEERWTIVSTRKFQTNAVAASSPWLIAAIECTYVIHWAVILSLGAWTVSASDGSYRFERSRRIVERSAGLSTIAVGTAYALTDSLIQFATITTTTTTTTNNWRDNIALIVNGSVLATYVVLACIRAVILRHRGSAGDGRLTVTGYYTLIPLYALAAFRAYSSVCSFALAIAPSFALWSTFVRAHGAQEMVARAHCTRDDPVELTVRERDWVNGRTGPSYAYVCLPSDSRWRWYCFAVIDDLCQDLTGSNDSASSRCVRLVSMRRSNVIGALFSRNGDRLGDTTTTHLITVRVAGPFDARLDESTKIFANAYDAMDAPRVIPFSLASTRPFTARRVRWFDEKSTVYDEQQRGDNDKDTSDTDCVTTTTIYINDEASIHRSHCDDNTFVFLCEESSVFYALDSVQQLRKFVVAPIVVVIWLIADRDSVRYVETFLTRADAHTRVHFRTILTRRIEHREISFANVPLTTDILRRSVVVRCESNASLGGGGSSLYPNRRSCSFLTVEHGDAVSACEIATTYVQHDAVVVLACRKRTRAMARANLRKSGLAHRSIALSTFSYDR